MTQIVFHDWGRSGPVALLLHGIGSSGAGFAKVAANLKHWQVMAWDMPGYGGSDPLPQDWPDAGDYASALAAALTERETGPVHVLGHSLGALVAARFARRYPEMVTGLTLASPALGHKTVPPALSDATARRLADFEAEGAEAFAAKRAPRLLSRPTEADLAAVTAQMAALKAKGHRAAARLLSAGDLLADVAELAVPASMVVGADDVITPPDAARACHDACPDPWRGPLTLIDGAGHALATQAPAALAETIDHTFFKNRRST